MTAPELKSCPFCGGKPSHNDGGNSRYGRFWWRVGCVYCGVFFDDEEKWDASSPGNLDQSYPPKQCFEVWNTRATHDRLIAEAVATERERIAAWHDREAMGAMNSLHCGSENSEYRAANRMHDFHKTSAAAIRGQS